MKRAVKILITGSVQGMFFRQFIKDQADSLNLRGFVRKLEDLRIEVFAEGDSQNIDKMIGICAAGPKHAYIKGIKVIDQHLQDFKDFKILNI